MVEKTASTDSDIPETKSSEVKTPSSWRKIGVFLVIMLVGIIVIYGGVKATDYLKVAPAPPVAKVIDNTYTITTQANFTLGKSAWKLWLFGDQIIKISAPTVFNKTVKGWINPTSGAFKFTIKSPDGMRGFISGTTAMQQAFTGTAGTFNFKGQGISGWIFVGSNSNGRMKLDIRYRVKVG